MHLAGQQHSKPVSMGSKAVSSWQHFIQLVDQLPQAADPTSLFNRMVHCNNTDLDNLPPCSPAEWEALVLKKKVKRTFIAALHGQMGCGLVKPIECLACTQACPTGGEHARYCTHMQSTVERDQLGIHSMSTIHSAPSTRRLGRGGVTVVWQMRHVAARHSTAQQPMPFIPFHKTVL